MRRVRLAAIALVAQGAMNSLNPVMRVRRPDRSTPCAITASRLSERGRSMRVVTALLEQRRPAAARSRTRFPHELSGGMKQRVCIAIAISLRPKVIIADEPTSALDVVVQRQVMETLRRSRSELGASVILVGHDMGLMAQFVDRLGVMYAGELVEVSTGARRSSPSRCIRTPSC